MAPSRKLWQPHPFERFANALEGRIRGNKRRPRSQCQGGGKTIRVAEFVPMLQRRRLDRMAYVRFDDGHSTLKNLNVMKRSLLADISQQNVKDLSHMDDRHEKARLLPLGPQEQVVDLLRSACVSYFEVAKHGICVKNIVLQRRSSRRRSSCRSRSRFSSSG